MQERSKKGNNQKTKKLACKLIGSFGIQLSTEDPAPVLQPCNKVIGIQVTSSCLLNSESSVLKSLFPSLHAHVNTIMSVPPLGIFFTYKEPFLPL